ncbi:MAG: LpqB family beta-propeller domain-containing protein [Streptosporangiaceae bacterium]
MVNAGPVTRKIQGRLAPARTLAVLLAFGLVASMAGCAAVPTGGTPQKVTGGSGQPQAYALPMPPPPPKVGWTEDDVVLGFLHASASFAANWAAARQYLANPLRQTWTPETVTVVGSLGKPAVSYAPAAPVPGGPTEVANVSFTGQRLATLTASGQYLYEPGNSVYTFKLVRTNGTWLIDGVPKGVLLLTQADFEDVYQPSNLYFFAPATPSVPLGDLLVPDPVYAPIQGITHTTSASNATLATSLVRGLLRGPGSWLSGAAKSFFPAGTKLIGQVRISGQTAIVNLGGGALRAQGTQIANMAAQLQYTLTTGAYSAPVAHFVKLEIGSKSVYTEQQPHLIAPVANTQVPEPVYFQSGLASVSELASPTAKREPAAGPAQIGQSVVTAVAASIGTSPRLLAIATKASSGCAVYVGASRASTRYRGYPLSSKGGACTSLSWDLNGNIWATAGQRIWLIRQHRAPVQVGLPAGLPAGPATGHGGVQVLALRMAPDGIRAAFLVHAAGGNRLLLAAVRYSGAVASFGPAVSVGTGLAKVRSISWYDPYNLVALAGSAVYEVPLTGGAGQQRPLGAAPDGAESITTNGTELVVGIAGDQNQLVGATNFDTGWSELAQGSGPAFPG